MPEPTIFSQSALVRLIEIGSAHPEGLLKDHLIALLQKRRGLDVALKGALQLTDPTQTDDHDTVVAGWAATPESLLVQDAQSVLDTLFTGEMLQPRFAALSEQQFEQLNSMSLVMLGEPFAEVQDLAKPAAALEARLASLRRMDQIASWLLGETLAFEAARRLLVYRPVGDLGGSVTLPLLAVALCLNTKAGAPKFDTPLPLMAVDASANDALKKMTFALNQAVNSALDSRNVLLTGRSGQAGLAGPRIDLVTLPARPGAYLGSMGGWLEPEGLTAVWRLQSETVWGWLSQLFGGATRWVLCNAVLYLAARVNQASAFLLLLPVHITKADRGPLKEAVPDHRSIIVEFVSEDPAGRGNGPVRAYADAADLAMLPATSRSLPREWEDKADRDKTALNLLISTLMAAPQFKIKNGRNMPGSIRALDGRDGRVVNKENPSQKCVWTAVVAGSGTGFDKVAVPIDEGQLSRDAFSEAYGKARAEFLALDRPPGQAGSSYMPTEDDVPQPLASDPAASTLYRAMFLADWTPVGGRAPVREKVLSAGRVIGSPSVTFDDGLFVLLAFAMVGQEKRAAGSFRQLADAWSVDSAMQVPMAALYALSPLQLTEASALLVRTPYGAKTGSDSSQTRPNLPLAGSYLHTLSSALQATPAQGAVGGESVTTWASAERKKILQPIVEGMLTRRRLQTIGSLIYALGGRSAGGIPDVLERFAKAWRNLEGFDGNVAAGMHAAPTHPANGAPAPMLPSRVWLLQELKAAGFTTVRHMAMSSPEEMTALLLNRHTTAPRAPMLSLTRQLNATAKHLAHHERKRARTRDGAVQSASSGQETEARKKTTCGSGTSPEQSAPNLQRLFGSSDRCECSEDDSVYGAPAYLVDVMEFLRFRTLASSTALAGRCLPATQTAAPCGDLPPQNALEVLLRRRPDLEHLDLSSDNTNREMPHIDLVNEILETAVAGERCTLADLVQVVYNDSPNSGNDWPPRGVPVPDDLAQQLRKQGINVTTAARFTKVDLPSAERVAHPCREILFLRDRGVALRFQRDSGCSQWTITRIKNSTRSNAALAAEPEYVNARACTVLASAASGFALPLSVGEALTQSYLDMVPARLADLDKAWCDKPEDPRRADSAAAIGGTAAARDEDRLRRLGHDLRIQLPTLQRIVAAQDAEDAEFWYWAKDKASGEICARAFLRGTRVVGERPKFSPLSTLCRTSFLGTDSELGLSVSSSAQGRDCNTDLRSVHWKGGKQAAQALQPVSRLLRLVHALRASDRSARTPDSALWTIEEVDQAIVAPRMGGGELGLLALEGIRDIRALQARLGRVARAEWLSMFGVIHYQGYRRLEDSLYWKLFLDPVRTQQGETTKAYAAFLPQSVKRGKECVGRWQAEIALRLDISEDDFKLLMSALGLESTATHITHELLSRLYAHCRVRRALNMRWADWLDWRELFVSWKQCDDMFDSPAMLLRFLDFVEEHKSLCTLKPGQLKRVLTGSGRISEQEDPESLLPRDKDVLSAIKAIAAASSGQLKQAFRILEERDRLPDDMEQPSLEWWQAWQKANPGPGEPSSTPLAKSIWEPVAALADLMCAARESALQNPSADPYGLRLLPLPEELRADGKLFKDFEAALGDTPADSLGNPPSPVNSWSAIEPTWARMLAWAGFSASAAQRLTLVGQNIAAMDRARSEIARASPEGAANGDVVADALAAIQRAQQAIFYLLQGPLIAMTQAGARVDAIAGALTSVCKSKPAQLKAMLQYMKVGTSNVLDQLVIATDWKKVQRQLADTSALAEINRSAVLVPTDPDFGKVWLSVLRLVRASKLMAAVKLEDEAWSWVLGADGRALNFLDPLALPSWRWEVERNGVTVVSTQPEQLAKDAEAVVANQWGQLLHLVRLEADFPAVEPAPSSGETVSIWKILRAVLRLQEWLAGDKPPKDDEVERAVRSLCGGLDILLSATSESAWKILCTDWNQTDLEATALEPSMKAQDVLLRLRCLHNYPRLREVFEWQRQTGLPLSLMHKLCRDPGDEAERLQLAAQVRSVLKGRVTEEDWFGNLKESMNRVREAKRDALVDYLLSHGAPGGHRFENVKSLYKHYLIDVEKAAGEMTSRIVQAHATVQLFVRRCLMGLEPQVKVEGEAVRGWEPWSWMKEYRVWQAARKIFLYPENWLYPELRDDRSVFFKEFQADLSQNKLDKSTVQDSVLAYLHKLQDVAHLEVISSFTEVDGSRLTVHVVGRTQTEPRAYYYRRWIEQREWTPWERIEVEINGDHVIVFAHHGRIYLAWLIAELKPKRAQSFSLPKNDQTPVKPEDKSTKQKWVMRLALSQHVQGAWSAKRVSPSALDLDSENMEDDASTEELKRVQLVYEQTGDAVVSVLRTDLGNKDEPVASRPLGSFLLSTCSGVAEAVRSGKDINFAIFPTAARTTVNAGRLLEMGGATSPSDDSLVLLEGPGSGVAVAQLDTTPGLFKLAIPRQASLLDLTAGIVGIAASGGANPGSMRTVGAWLPSFYQDDESSDVLVEPDETLALQRLLGSLSDWTLRSGVAPKLKSALSSLTDRIDGGRFNDDEVALALREVADISAEWIGKLGSGVPQALGDDRASVRLYEGRMLHPEACNLIRIASGHADRWLVNLYSRELQDTPFRAVRGRSEKSTIAFDLTDGYASYNWEIFVHIPLLLAQRHADVGDYEAAFLWFKQIFNPQAAGQRVRAGVAEAPLDNYWIAKPFANHTSADYDAQRIDLLLDPDRWALADAADPDVAGAWKSALRGLRESVAAWRLDPANPYQIARHRWVAYQKAVVYQLIKMLVDWGDAKFRLFEREALTQATQIYELASELLGERPIVDVPENSVVTFSYEEIRVDLDQDNDELLKRLASPREEADAQAMAGLKSDLEATNATLSIYNDHFCIPQNEELSRLWDKVEDRLYKLRHSQDIDGIERVLALFSPPIDPGALVRARGAGLSLGEVLSGLAQPLPHHRFSAIWALAMDFARELRALGSELQSALEKKDGEDLALLRIRHEREVLDRTRNTRKLQINEARIQVEALNALLNTVKERQSEYIGREEISQLEQQGFDLTRAGVALRIGSQIAHMLGSAVAAGPQLNSGFAAIGPLFYASWGSVNVSSVASAFGTALAALADIRSTEAGVVATRASYRRRKEEWNFQAKQAASEIKQIEKQIGAAELRVALSEAELATLELQLDHVSQQVDYLKGKFTNAELYDWLARQATALYYRSYQLALEFARKAERCLDFELPPQDPTGQSPVVGAAYWDGSHRGLSSANGLISALNQLKAEHSKRDVPHLPFPISFSLRDQDPMALLRLRTAGRCRFSIKKAFLDRIFPGHVQWRIHDHAWSMDSVAGPNTPIAVRLTLSSSRIFFEADEQGRASINPTPVRADYSCTGRSDSSRIRYTPDSSKYGLFEFAGVISDWEIEIPGNQLFDWSSISDFTLTLSVSCRQIARLPELEDIGGPRLMVSLRDNFMTEFAQLLGGTGAVPISIGSTLTHAGQKYEPAEVADDPDLMPQVCMLARTPAKNAANFRVFSADGSLLNTKSVLKAVPPKRPVETTQLFARVLTKEEVQALITGGRVVLLDGGPEIVDLVLLLPPRKPQ